MSTHIGGFDVVLKLSRRRVPQEAGESGETVAIVRMSLEHAKAITMLLKRNLREFEDRQRAPIVLHPEIYKALGISPQEDW